MTARKPRQVLRALEEVDPQARDRLQRIDVGEVGDVRQADHRNRGVAGRGGPRHAGRVFDRDRVLAFDADVGEPGQHAEHRPAGARLDPAHAVREEREVAAKAVDDDPPDHVPLARLEAREGADDLREDAPAVDVRDQHHGGRGLLGHAQVDEIAGHEVHLGAGPGPLEDHELVRAAQPCERRGRRAEEPLLAAVVVRRKAVALDLTQHHHLRAQVARRFQEDRVHVDLRGDARGLGLDDLRAPHFQALGGDPGVVGHVLGLEGRDPDPPAQDGAAERGDDDALADVRPGAEHSDAGGAHFSIPFRAGTPAWK